MIKKIKKNRKGFTLIELLAVIVILGVLMIIAIPMVSQYIRQSRQSAFIDTARSYINAARYAYMNGNVSCTTIDVNPGTIYITLDQLKVDRSNGQSAFGGTIDAAVNAVAISHDGNGNYTYYIALMDSKNNGWTKYIAEKDLNRNSVKTGLTATKPAINTKPTGAYGTSNVITKCDVSDDAGL